MSQHGESLVIKHKRGKVLSSGERTIVINVINELVEKYSTLAIKNIIIITSEFTGVSHNIDVRKEILKTGKISSPIKKQKCQKPVLDQ